jgi:valyl-tRNA synthetase
MLAPFLPFISETLYINLVKGESVHLTDWPKIDVDVDRTLLDDMRNIRLVVEAAHALRKEKQIPVRQPLSLLNSTINFEKPDDQFIKYLLDEVNIKKWDVKKGSVLSNKFNTKITPELKEEAETRLLIRKIQNERRNMGLNLTQKTRLISPWLPKSNINIQILMKKTSTVDIHRGNVFKLQKTS